MSSTGDTIAVIGLGYVGLPLAVAFARKRRGIGFDIDQGRIDELNAGHDRTREVSDAELAEAAKVIENTQRDVNEVDLRL